jgi:hypothetical protein
MSKDPEYYNIVQRTEYSMAIEPCDDIENLSDSFLHISKVPNYNHNPHKRVIYEHEKIKALLLEWSTMIKEGKASCRTVPAKVQHLIESVPLDILQKNTPYGFTVSRSRIENDRVAAVNKNINEKIKHEKQVAETKVKREKPYVRSLEGNEHKDRCYLVRALYLCVRGSYDVRYTISLKNPEHVKYVKRLCSWYDLNKLLRDKHFIILPEKQRSQDLPHIKQIWDNL